MKREKTLVKEKKEKKGEWRQRGKNREREREMERVICVQWLRVKNGGEKEGEEKINVTVAT